MWQRFTEKARRVVFDAQEEAAQLGQSYVGTEHLLLGLLRGEGSVGCRILEQAGISVARLAGAFKSELRPGSGAAQGDIQLTPRGKLAIDFAYDEARRLDNNYIGTEHLLLGLIRERDGLAAKALASAGVELDAVRLTVAALQASAEPASGLEPSMAQGRRSGKRLSMNFFRYRLTIEWGLR